MRSRWEAYRGVKERCDRVEFHLRSVLLCLRIPCWCPSLAAPTSVCVPGWWDGEGSEGKGVCTSATRSRHMKHMNVDLSRAHDLFFGPPSEPIEVGKFIEETARIHAATAEDVLTHPSWQELSAESRAAIEAECSGSIAELKTTIEDVWNNPMISAHLYTKHDDAISSALGQADGLAQKGRKRKRLDLADQSRDTPELQALQEYLQSVPLRCWEFGKESSLFMRTSRNSDFNAFRSVKKTGQGNLSRHYQLTDFSYDLNPEEPTTPDALITLTVYNRVPWVQSYLVRMSQHAVLASQTLEDFMRSIPCDSSEMPVEEVDAEGDVTGYSLDTRSSDGEEGCLLLIEDVVYGDGRPGVDYAEKLLSHVSKLPQEKRPVITKSSAALGRTTFNSLTLRINQPYWMLHQGNCEHFIVVDQIRLPHPSDPASGYPLMLHLTPALSELCKACSKAPAVISVVGDIRLGESPCLLCGPCWRSMGSPKDDGEVMVVPLVAHNRSWAEGGGRR